MTDYAKTLTDAARAIAPETKLTQPEVDLLDHVAALWAAREKIAATPVVPATGSEPPWVKVGRSLIGQREIVGPKNNSWIANGWAKLGAGWFNDDETPWCGFFVAWCMDQCGLPYPGGGSFASAGAWKNWGRSVIAQYGAIGVKARAGGNHVFQIVGITPDGRYYKCLGGNQGNMVSIADILIASVTTIRWPATVVDPVRPLPVMPRGTVTTEG